MSHCEGNTFCKILNEEIISEKNEMKFKNMLTTAK